MKAIRYSLHFPILIVAALVYWWATGFDVWIFDFDFFHYGLMGTLHSAAIVVALGNPRAREPIVVFRVLSLSFIALATLWGAVTPIMSLYGVAVWGPITAFLPPGRHNDVFIFATGSVIGSSGYWLFVHLFWLKSLRRADLFRTVALRVAATILVVIVGDGILRNLPDRVLSLLLTAMWWLAFSVSLYWSEMSTYGSKPTEVIA